MATTKRTTKAKTKTAAAKTTRKNTKVTKAAPKKTTTKKSVAAKAVPRKSLLARFRGGTSATQTTHVTRWLALCVVAYILVIAAVLTFMNPAYTEVTVPYQTVDPLAASSELAPASRVLYTMDLRWLVIALAVISLLLPLRHLIRHSTGNRSAVRWAEVTLATAIMVEGVALLSGWTDIVTIKLLWALLAAGGLIGYLQDRYAADKKRFSVQLSRSSALIFAFITLLLVGTMFMSYLFGLVTPHWVSYGSLLAVVAGWILYARNYAKSIGSDGRVINRNFWLITLATRVAFSALIIGNFLK